ncbi:MAG: Mor transcription activator family protein [Betaproteobacteria bacterium]
MWIPSQFRPDYHLVAIIGHEPMIKLIKAYGGERLEIPKCDGAMRAVRNFKICESDKSQALLAHEYDLTVRHIRNIQCDMPEDDKQENLF